MAKEKLKKVGSWKHDKSGIDVDYYLEGTRFVCTVLEEKLSAPEAAVLRHKVMDKLEHWMTMEWFPIIQVEVSSEASGGYRDEPEGDGLAINVKRFYMTRSPAGAVMRCEWDVDEEHRKAKMSRYGGSDIALTRLPLKAPFQTSSGRYGGNTVEYLLDYSEEVWGTIQSMILALGQMRAQISKLFKTRDGIAKLQAGGSRLLLGAGEPKGKRE